VDNFSDTGRAVRPVRTKRGVTMVGLFSAAITRAEREADAP
jgi:hypothetical protein